MPMKRAFSAPRWCVHPFLGLKPQAMMRGTVGALHGLRVRFDGGLKPQAVMEHVFGVEYFVNLPCPAAHKSAGRETRRRGR